MNDLIQAILVHDGGDNVVVPEPMLSNGIGPDQNQGTALERLAEVAGRCCYDSYGKGRPSDEWHKHILNVGHLSVYRHCYFTADIASVESIKHFGPQLLNRPGVYVRKKGNGFRGTFNLESVLTWAWFANDWTPSVDYLKLKLHRIASFLAPAVMGDYTSSGVDIVEPENEHEQFVTLFLSGSRLFSHEMVRHHHECAVSQRSTRYVDESETQVVDHPLWTEKYGCMEANDSWRHDYYTTAGMLCGFLIARGVDKTTIIKQARGAARAYIPSNLYTEMIFTASVAQWKRMIRARCSVAADAEIREVFAKALGVLKRCRYGEAFDGFQLEHSPDTIGMIAVEDRCHERKD